MPPMKHGTHILMILQKLHAQAQQIIEIHGVQRTHLIRVFFSHGGIQIFFGSPKLSP